MKSENQRETNNAKTEYEAEGIQRRFALPKKRSSRIRFALLLILYLATSFMVSRVSRSDKILVIGERTLPIATFSGVLTSFANICIIFLTMFYGHLGFVTSLALLLLQFPMMISMMLLRTNLSSIPGVFINIFTIIAIILIHLNNLKIENYQLKEVAHLKEQRRMARRLFEQTATALVSAIDAKDNYSRGHSMRVAEYSEKLARRLGKSENECNEIYYAALLHDVGKIGIDDEIISKNGRLTKEEYAVIKQHPTIGNQILSSISEYPYLSIGAHYHHERYDGKGYPEGLKGRDIPEIARIILVADAYDAMTSNRSYREAIPQQLVREEIVKGAGTQFDPEFARLMQFIIDEDPSYSLKEKTAVKEFAGKNEMRCVEYRGEVSEGIAVTQEITDIHIKFIPDKNLKGEKASASIILFDSLDERVHDEENIVRDMNYYEYGEVWLDGRSKNTGVRKIKTEIIPNDMPKAASVDGSVNYDIKLVKCKDHVLIMLNDGEKTTRVTIALPDSARFVYAGITGEYCLLSDVSINKADNKVPDDYIPRIAEEISFLDGPVGDIPNIQINGYRYASSEGIPVTDGLKISFHAMSLPTARLIWHCPYISIFYADDGKVNGKNYREYGFIRLDGEDWQEEGKAHNRQIVNMSDEFEGWNEWKQFNRKGFDCVVNFEYKDNKIIVTTENMGLSIRSITTILDGTKKFYTSLTGDQCVITNIRYIM